MCWTSAPRRPLPPPSLRARIYTRLLILIIEVLLRMRSFTFFVVLAALASIVLAARIPIRAPPTTVKRTPTRTTYDEPLTNAQRFARGLPPLAPKRRYAATGQ